MAEVIPAQPDRSTRRALLLYALEKIAVPASLGIAGVYAGVRLNQRYEERHELSIDLFQETTASTYNLGGQLFDGYMHGVHVRNIGDYAEAQVNLSFRLFTDDESTFNVSNERLARYNRGFLYDVSSLSEVDIGPSHASVILEIERMIPDEYFEVMLISDRLVSSYAEARSEDVSLAVTHNALPIT